MSKSSKALSYSEIALQREAVDKLLTELDNLALRLDSLKPTPRDTIRNFTSGFVYADFQTFWKDLNTHLRETADKLDEMEAFFTSQLGKGFTVEDRKLKMTDFFSDESLDQWRNQQDIFEKIVDALTSESLAQHLNVDTWKYFKQQVAANRKLVTKTEEQSRKEKQDDRETEQKSKAKKDAPSKRNSQKETNKRSKKKHQPPAFSKGAIRRLARRGGVKRISGNLYVEAEKVANEFLGFIIGDINNVMGYSFGKHRTSFGDTGHRTTVTSADVIYALKRLHKHNKAL